MKSDRREFLKSMAATAVAPAICASRAVAEAEPGAVAASHQAPRSAMRPKNVVLMICDDLGYGDLASIESIQDNSFTVRRRTAVD